MLIFEKVEYSGSNLETQNFKTFEGNMVSESNYRQKTKNKFLIFKSYIGAHTASFKYKSMTMVKHNFCHFNMTLYFKIVCFCICFNTFINVCTAQNPVFQVLNSRPYRLDTEIFIELEKFITYFPLYKLVECQPGLMEDPSDFILF